MSITLVGSTLNADRPSCRLAIVANVKDFWDATNKRWKSGIVTATVSNLTWTGTAGGSEKLNITIQPPNYNQACNNKTVLTPNVSADAWGGSSAHHQVAINYGVPDPSTIIESDGSITLAVVDLALPLSSSSSITPTMTYEVNFESVDPYSTIAADDDTVLSEFGATLSVDPATPADWGMIGIDLGGADPTDGKIVVQLQSLVSSVGVGVIPAPHFQFSNPARSGNSINKIDYQLPNTDSRNLSFKDNFTWVFALNLGKIDANATPVKMSSGSGLLYNVANFGLVGDNLTGQATAMLNYNVLSPGSE
jgi:hypothetical protein